MNDPDFGDEWTLIRGDRLGTENPGGGVMTLINENIGFKRNGFCNRDGVELLGTSIGLSGKIWMNIYTPPDIPTDISWLPTEEDSMHAGDFNDKTMGRYPATRQQR